MGAPLAACPAGLGALLSLPPPPYPQTKRRTWDDGTANTEPALDKFTLVSSNTALAWVAAGLGFFAVVGTTMKLLAPAERRPWVRGHRAGCGELAAAVAMWSPVWRGLRLASRAFLGSAREQWKEPLKSGELMIWPGLPPAAG